MLGREDLRLRKESFKQFMEVEEWCELLVVWVFHVVIDRRGDLHGPRETVCLQRQERLILDEPQRREKVILGQFDLGSQWTEALIRVQPRGKPVLGNGDREAGDGRDQQPRDDCATHSLINSTRMLSQVGKSRWGDEDDESGKWTVFHCVDRRAELVPSSHKGCIVIRFSGC